MADLAHVLRSIPRYDDANLLLGGDPADDAAVYRLSEELALVQTVDFFTPIVDDPYVFGQIAAANSLSDVYALGGQPLTALNIVGFPMTSLPLDILGQILRGGADKAGEAGVPIVGGHTVEDDEPKYGLAVTGTVNPRDVITAHGAQPGDVLVLTKPIGTGVISTALKSGIATMQDVDQATRWMTTLNLSPSEAMKSAGANACTDITGYGLLGHLVDMCKASGVSASIASTAVPLLPGALAYSREGAIPGGTRTNREAVQDFVKVSDGVDDALLTLLADAQTSGGLLISLPEDRLSALQSAATEDMIVAAVGRIGSEGAGVVQVSV